jgi:nicotinamide mononucleotide adenylyltransferase
LFKGLDPLKTLINVKDDIFLTAKTLLIRQLPGNNNALFLGRFSPLTIAHYNIIDDAIKQYDGVVVNLVKSKLDSDNPFPVEMQIDMLKRCFGDSIEITTSSTGNVLTIIPKTKKVITTVLAGTDRIEGYKKQLLKNEEITVVEIPRTNSISGSLVRKSLRENDKKTFETNTPKQLWGMFDKLRNYV